MDKWKIKERKKLPTTCVISLVSSSKKETSKYSAFAEASENEKLKWVHEYSGYVHFSVV